MTTPRSGQATATRSSKPSTMHSPQSNFHVRSVQIEGCQGPKCPTKEQSLQRKARQEAPAHIPGRLWRVGWLWKERQVQLQVRFPRSSL